MALFAAGDETGGQGKGQGLSIIAADMRFIGDLETDGVVKIEGKVEGNVRARGQVLVARGGVVEGDIYTAEVVVSGEVRGRIFADDRIEVQPGAAIHGDITAPRFSVLEGGNIDGLVRTPKPDVPAKTLKGKGGGPDTAPWKANAAAAALKSPL